MELSHLKLKTKRKCIYLKEHKRKMRHKRLDIISCISVQIARHGMERGSEQKRSFSRHFQQQLALPDIAVSSYC